MMNIWKQLKRGIVLHDGTEPVRIICPHLSPIVVQDGTTFHPCSWEKQSFPTEELVKWKFSSGPIKEVGIYTDAEESLLLVNWR